MRPSRPSSLTRSFRLLAGAAAALLIAGVASVATSAPAQAAALPDSISGGGYIISDDEFFRTGTMTSDEIQAFLESKAPSCKATSGPPCLKDFRADMGSVSADKYCGAIEGGTGLRASDIIARVGDACGINPKVILVMLQKEQGLVLSSQPSDWSYRAAMGQMCPDDAPCDAAAAGFVNQVRLGTRQQQIYVQNPGSFRYKAGQTNTIQWSPDKSCGTSEVYIENQATANLYNYTPYRPNAAALAAGYGTGDRCSSYGNRNFYLYYVDWFGRDGSGTVGQPAGSGACAVPVDVQDAAGAVIVDTDLINARQAPSTDCTRDVVQFSRGQIAKRTGVYGQWWRVSIDGSTYWMHSDFLAEEPAPPYTTARIAGDDRYATSALASAAAFPGGADVVYLASGADFPDALAAAAAAAGDDASLLLASRTGLSAAVRDELQRLAPQSVVLVGGTGVLGAEVVDAVAAALPGADVQRIAGENRYETSRLLASEGRSTAATIYVAAGRTYADALVASAVAGAENAPVILVDGAADGLDAATLDTLRSLSVGNAVIAGGTGTVSSGVESALASSGIAVTRHGGADRYATSQLLNAASYGGSVPRAYVATGVDFPDALSSAVLAGTTRAPLFSQPAACMTDAAKDFFLARGTSTVTLVGGTGSLSDAVARSERC